MPVLPAHRDPACSAAPPEFCKFVIQSSDVLEDMRINVREDGSEKVIWFKERFLSEDEIVENIVDNATSKLCWTIHRPKRGWYIRLRAPTFPPDAYIALAPVPTSSPFHAEAALSFSSRTNTRASMSMRSPQDTTKSPMEVATSSSGSAVVHSYPPTPPAPVVTIQPPSPRSVHQKLDELFSAERPRRQPTAITQFILTPYSAPHVPQPESASFFTRALSVFRNSKPSHSSSFTLSPLPRNASSSRPGSEQTTGEPIVPSNQNHRHSQSIANLLPPAPTPLLTFHDRTPVWTVRSTTGLVEINVGIERELGVDRSFWITTALAYMEFLGERESYLAAADG